ncbi:MAG: hypothetical protein GXO23_06030 [Crenarchaeota archaeon]|nr:hypothetical protein [Thermoproteota archaeon]
MREIAHILLGIAVAGIAVLLLALFSQGISHINLHVNLSQIPTNNVGGSSSPVGNFLRKVLGKLAGNFINYNRLTFNLPNRSLLNQTVFTVYGPPGSTYGDITYFQVATYSTFRDGVWQIDTSGTYSHTLVSRCPYGVCTTSCYSVKLVLNMNYLPHNGYPYIVRPLTRGGKYLYDEWTNMLKNIGLREYSICVYVPHINLYKALDIPLSKYENLSTKLRIYVQIDPTARKLLREKFLPLISSCRTLRCVIYRILSYINMHYRYVRYVEIPQNENPILYILRSREANCLEANTLLVLTLRSLGIPARLVAGFIGSPYSEYQEIKLIYAHAWSQVYVPGIGWVIVDATPGIVREYLDMLRNRTANRYGINITRLDVTRISSRESVIVGEVKARDLSPGIYELYVTYLDYYLPNNTWIRKNVPSYPCNELYTLSTLIQDRFIEGPPIKYQIKLFIPLKYVPHIDYAVSTLPGAINPESNEIMSNDETSFTIESVRIGRSMLPYLLNIPLKVYDNLNVPSIYLQVPKKDERLLREVVENITSGCRTLLCVLKQVYIYAIHNLNYIVLLSNARSRTEPDIIENVLKNSTVTLPTMREYFTVADTLVVLLLRARGIPARLAVGFETPLSMNGGLIRGNIVVWPQVYVPIENGLWVDLPYQPLLALLVLGEMSHSNRTLVIVRGGGWRCFRIGLYMLYLPGRHYKVTLSGLPRDVYYRANLESSGKYLIKYVRICLHAGDRAPLGSYPLNMTVSSSGISESIGLKLLIKARTMIRVESIYPRYIAPGSSFIVKGVLTDDEGRPVPNQTVYIYVMTHKKGRVITTCLGKTLINGTFIVTCSIPPYEPVGLYYVKAVFKGSELYANSSTDPYIYVTQRPMVRVSIDASCTLLGNIALICITNSTNLTVRVRSSEKIVRDAIVRVYGAPQYVVKRYDDTLSISLKNILQPCTVLVRYPGSRDYSYFNIIIRVYRVNMTVRAENCTRRDNTYMCFPSATLQISLTNLSTVTYGSYIYVISQNGTTVRSIRTNMKSRINIELRDLPLGPLRVVTCVRPIPYIETIPLLGAIPQVLRDPPLLQPIYLKCISFPPTIVEVVSIAELENIHITYTISLLLSFQVMIKGEVIDKFSKRPVRALVCVGDICTRSRDGTFSLAVSLFDTSPVIRVRPLANFYVGSYKSIRIPLVLLMIPLVTYMVIGGIACFVAFRTVRYLTKRRRRALVFYGVDRAHGVRGLIKIVNIGPDEPPVWGINEPLRVEVDARRGEEPVPDSEIVVKIDNIYTGSGRVHEVTISEEGTYRIELYVNSIKICEAYIRVVNYRSEIGRIFDEVVRRVLGEDSRYLTPREIASRLVEKGVPSKIANKIVRIHERVTYAKVEVDRRTFLEFVTLIKYVDRKYNLAGVPQT